MNLCLLLIFSSTTEAHLLHPLPLEDYILIPLATVFLTLIAGIVSGLTVGMMGIDKLALELKLESGTADEKYYARRILPLLEDRYLLLVTLLITNSVALETMPILLEEMIGGVPSVIICVLVSLFFSEVIPQALCTGRFQIPLASAFATFTKGIIYLFYPISYPIARVLDKVVGRRRKSEVGIDELKVVFKLQMDCSKTLDGMDKSQVQVINNVIEFRDKRISEILLPVSKVFAISEELVLDDANLQWIKEKGYSRIPLLGHSNQFTGLLDITHTILCTESAKAKDLSQNLNYINEDLSIFDALHLMRQSKVHLSLISLENKIVGLITLNDIIKELSRPETDSSSELDSYLATDETVIVKKSFFKRIFCKFGSNQNIRAPLISDIELDKFKSFESDITIIINK